MKVKSLESLDPETVSSIAVNSQLLLARAIGKIPLVALARQQVNLALSPLRMLRVVLLLANLSLECLRIQTAVSLQLMAKMKVQCYELPQADKRQRATTPSITAKQTKLQLATNLLVLHSLKPQIKAKPHRLLVLSKRAKSQSNFNRIFKKSSLLKKK